MRSVLAMLVLLSPLVADAFKSLTEVETYAQSVGLQLQKKTPRDPSMFSQRAWEYEAQAGATVTVHEFQSTKTLKAWKESIGSMGEASSVVARGRFTVSVWHEDTDLRQFLQAALTGDMPASAVAKRMETIQKAADESAAYAAKIQLLNVKVGTSAGGTRGIFGEVKNSGERVAKLVEIVVYALGEDGKPVHEETFRPVWQEGFSNREPLKPNYARKFGFSMEDAPSEWSGEVRVEVKRVALAE